MNKKAILLIALMITSMIFISGCTQIQTGVKSVEGVAKTVTNENTVQIVKNTFNSIGKTLSGNK